MATKRGGMRKRVDRVIDVPAHDEESGFVLFETLIDNHRQNNHVNVVSFWCHVDDSGKDLPHIKHLGNKHVAMTYYVQICDRSIRELGALDAASARKHKPDYNRPFDEALHHAVEIKRKRMYVRIVGYGLGGVKVRLRINIHVESKRPHYDYEHIRNPTVIQSDTLPVGGSRVVSRVT